MTLITPRRVRKISPVNLTKPIKKSDLGRALLQALEPAKQPQRNDLKAVGLVITAAIGNQQLEAIAPGTDQYSFNDLISFARNRVWKKTLERLNALCKQCIHPHGALVRLIARGEAKTSSRTRKSMRRPVRKIPELVPPMPSAVGSVFVVVDETSYPDNYSELLVLAKQLYLDKKTLQNEIERLRASLNN